MKDIKDYIRESRHQEVDNLLEKTIQELKDEGFDVEFGRIGLRTNYAMIYDADHNTEIVGYTFIKDIRFYSENIGKLKALQQAIARKKLSDQKE